MLAKAIHGAREELIALAVANGGNTRGDAKFDIDGGAVTLSHYAELGAKLGGSHLLPDGEPIQVGRTLVVSSGSHGKFLSRLDLDVRGGRVAAHRYRLLPVLSGALAPDPDMARLIAEIRGPHEARLAETLAVSDSLLYRRGNFNGTFDEVILDALLKRGDAQVAFSPGFRWGVTMVPGQSITLEDVMSHTALTYANTWAREMTGAEIHAQMAAELIDGNRSYSELTPLQARAFLAGLAALAVLLGWRFQARRFDVLDWRVASFAVVAADALVFKFAHLILPFTLAAFAWVLGITLGTQTRGAAAWLAHRFGRRA